MKVNLLNVRIEIQRNTVTTDAVGNHRQEWETVYTCYATVSGESGKESTDAGIIVDDSKADFTVRWCAAVAEITSTEYRVMFNGQIYNILGVDHMNYKHKAVKLLCQKARR